MHIPHKKELPYKARPATSDADIFSYARIPHLHFEAVRQTGYKVSLMLSYTFHLLSVHRYETESSRNWYGPDYNLSTCMQWYFHPHAPSYLHKQLHNHVFSCLHKHHIHQASPPVPARDNNPISVLAGNRAARIPGNGSSPIQSSAPTKAVFHPPAVPTVKWGLTLLLLISKNYKKSFVSWFIVLRIIHAIFSCYESSVFLPNRVGLFS